jgi:hypothetical protein
MNTYDTRNLKVFVMTNLKGQIFGLIWLIFLLIITGGLFAALYQSVIQSTQDNRLSKINELQKNTQFIDQVKLQNRKLSLYSFDPRHGAEIHQWINELNSQAFTYPDQMSSPLDDIKTHYSIKEITMNTDYGFWFSMPTFTTLVWGVLGIIFTNLSNSIYKCIARILKGVTDPPFHKP